MTNGNFINNITFAIPRIVVTIKCGNEVNLLFFVYGPFAGDPQARLCHE